ncbi:MAG: P22 phage major capsid protein family protein [Terriglobia bacterium]
MANTLLTISMITREALRILENNICFTKHVRRDFDDAFGVAGAKIGTTLNVRKPPRYQGRIGQTLAVENATEVSVPLTLSQQVGADLQFTSQDLTLSIDDFAERFIEPAVAIVANKIDFDGLQQYSNVYNEVGTPGTVPNSLQTYLTARQRQNDEAVPIDSNRALVVSSGMEATIINALSTLFNDVTEVSRQYKEGTMGRVIGYKWNMSQNSPVQTVGAGTSMPTVSGASQTGSSLLVTGGSASVNNFFNKGDIITVANVYAVNPLNAQSTGSLRQFVVTANTSSPASGTWSIPIYPAITPATALTQGYAGAFSTTNVSPASGAAVALQGTAGTSSPRGLAFHKEAFAVASADLLLPGGVDMASRIADKQVGFSIRIVRQYNIQNDSYPTRLDVLYGWTTLYPEFACRIAS